MIVAEAARKSAPWWGVPLIAGIFAILGVSATQWITWALDHRRSKREDARRWHADRRAAYAGFLVEAEALLMKTSGYLRARERGDSIGSRSAALDAAKVLNVRRYDLRLVASAEVRDAAEQLWDAFGNALRIQDRPEGDEPPTAKSFISQHRRHVDELLIAMRNELGTD